VESEYLPMDGIEEEIQREMQTVATRPTTPQVAAARGEVNLSGRRNCARAVPGITIGAELERSLRDKHVGVKAEVR